MSNQTHPFGAEKPLQPTLFHGPVNRVYLGQGYYNEELPERAKVIPINRYYKGKLWHRCFKAA